MPETCLKARLGHVEEDALAFAQVRLARRRAQTPGPHVRNTPTHRALVAARPPQELLCEEISTSVPRPAAPAPAEARAPRPSTHLGAGAATEAGILFRGAAPPAVVVVDAMARPAPMRQTIFNDVLAQVRGACAGAGSWPRVSTPVCALHALGEP